MRLRRRRSRTGERMVAPWMSSRRRVGENGVRLKSCHEIPEILPPVIRYSGELTVRLSRDPKQSCTVAITIGRRSQPYLRGGWS